MSKLNRDKLEEMTAVELKELLQKQGLSTSGNKQALVDRLFNANPGGAGVFVIEAVSSPRPKKAAAAPPTRHVPIATAAEAAEDAAADPTSGIATETPPTEPVADSPVPESAPTPPGDDAAALMAQLKDLIAQAQAAAEAAQKAQQAAEAAAASVKQKKEKKGKKGDKKKDKKKKD